MPRMTISRAISEMEPGDKWESDHYCAIMAKDKTLITCQGACLLMNHAILTEYGTITKAEPKVLTAQESMEKEYVSGDSTSAWKVGYIDGFEDGEPNGQLKEWNRTKELREAVRAYLNMYKGDTRSGHTMLVEALKNLKPPCQ